ncbi:MAG TPA: alkaline phosphatase family protein [Candidatus Limnocylindrales bacterium]|nr:alkaline phosphatase family protein [Candidatus Limnocylindrales bacterium]
MAPATAPVRRKPAPSRGKPIPRPRPPTKTAPAPVRGKTAAGPIQHVVIIVKENHTFDNYFGKFKGANGDATLAAASDPPTSDHPHDHHAWLNRAAGATREQYAEANIPSYWAYARQFTLCDRYFSAVAGPSTPNHLMLIAADSPIINNPHYRDPVSLRPPFNIPSLPQSLAQAGYTWRSYGSYAHQYITALQHDPNNLTSEHFAQDATAGTLPTVSWVYAPSGLSEHPVEIIKDGMAWTVQQVNAIVQGGLWPSTAIIITWDDWGGWFDHVTPPNVEAWSDGTQFRYGSRVPCLILSPYAKPGYVSTIQHSHISPVKFCEVTFGLGPLNARDQASDGLEDCFDFAQKPLAPPQS